MHSNNVNEPISPRTAALKNGGEGRHESEETRHHWHKVWKRNGGRKIKSLRSHRARVNLDKRVLPNDRD